MNKILLLLLVFSFNTLFAQDIDIHGTVKDAKDGSTMVGVNVLQQGTQNGVVTDINGNFSLTIPKGSTVGFSFIGYLKKEMVFNESQTVTIELAAENTTLDELIVIGYATQRKSDKTGAVATIKAEELNGGMLTDPVQAMQGKAAGVTITKGGGDPNSGFTVKIRGASGYESNTDPLYVIDGVPGADPTILAPDDIASYNILKDAASTAIYGSRGANGVIIITTKQGGDAKGECDGSYSRVDFNSQVSFDWVANKVKMMSAQEMRDFVSGPLLSDAQKTNPSYTADSIFNDGGASTDWQDEIYRMGVSYSTNLSLSGGNNTTNYVASVTRATWEGVMKGTSKERTSARFNVNHKAFDDKVLFSGGIMTSFEENDYESYGGWGKEDIIYQALSRNPTDPVYNDDGTYYKSNRVFNYENPIATINEITNTRTAKKLLGNFKVDYEVIKDLHINANLAYIRNDDKTDYFRPSGLFSGADNGFGKKQYNNYQQKLMELTANYTKTINEKHNLTFLAGYSYQESIYDGFYAQAGDAQSPHAGPSNLQTLGLVKYGDVGSWKGKSELVGFFGRVQYNMDRKYYVSASLRRDGSSKFGANNKWGWFPTAAIGWNIDKEDFMKNINWLDQLKVRASFGIAGNQEIGEYHSQLLWQPSGLAINPETGKEVVTFSPAQNANPDLKWESTSEINLGVDFAFFDSRLSGSLEVYSKITDDLLGSYAVPVPPNLASTTWANSGSIKNSGIELFIQGFVVDNKNFSWKSSFNISHNKTIITDLGSYVNSNVRKAGFISGRGLVGEEMYVTGLISGEEAGAFYVPEYVTMKNGEFIYTSESGGYTKNISEAKRYIAGTAAPDLEIGWSNSFNFYKQWSFDFALRSMVGNYVYNATQMFFDDPNNIPSLNGNAQSVEWYEEGRVSGAAIADLYVENASFLKVDYVALAYRFDVERYNWINNFTLFVSANNLYTLTGYSGIDPETSMNGLAYGIDQYNVYPKTRSLTFGLKASF